MDFVDAVEATPEIREHLKAGLQAIGAPGRKRIGVARASVLGSVDMDRALREAHPNAARWDYVVGAETSDDDTVVWIEVHSADSHHIDQVLRKLYWLRGWLKSRGRPMDGHPRRFVWIATSRVAFRKGSVPANKLAQAGLEFPVKHLSL